MTCCKQYKWARRAEATRHEMILIEITVKGHVMWYQRLFSFKGKVCLFSPTLPPPTSSQPTQVDYLHKLGRSHSLLPWRRVASVILGKVWWLVDFHGKHLYFRNTKGHLCLPGFPFMEGHANCALDVLELWPKRNGLFCSLAFPWYNCLFSPFLRLWLVS